MEKKFMNFSSDYYSSNQEQPQPDPLPFLSNLLSLQDPTAFITKYVEALQFGQQIWKEKAEADAHRIAMVQKDNKARNRLIAIIIEHAKSLGMNPYKDLPPLKAKSYDQLCEYIKDYWPELISKI